MSRAIEGEACVEDERRSGTCPAKEEQCAPHACIHARTKTRPRSPTHTPYLHARMVGRIVVIFWSDGVVARESSL